MGRIISVKFGLFFQEITIITEFRGSNFLLPTLLAGSKWDFPVANLLLATVNFEPWLEDYLLMKADNSCTGENPLTKDCG